MCQTIVKQDNTNCLCPSMIMDEHNLQFDKKSVSSIKIIRKNKTIRQLKYTLYVGTRNINYKNIYNKFLFKNL